MIALIARDRECRGRRAHTRQPLGGTGHDSGEEPGANVAPPRSVDLLQERSAAARSGPPLSPHERVGCVELRRPRLARRRERLVVIVQCGHDRVPAHRAQHAVCQCFEGPGPPCVGRLCRHAANVRRNHDAHESRAIVDHLLRDVEVRLDRGVFPLQRLQVPRRHRAGVQHECQGVGGGQNTPAPVDGIHAPEAQRPEQRAPGAGGISRKRESRDPNGVGVGDEALVHDGLGPIGRREAPRIEPRRQVQQIERAIVECLCRAKGLDPRVTGGLGRWQRRKCRHDRARLDEARSVRVERQPRGLAVIPRGEFLIGRLRRLGRRRVDPQRLPGALDCTEAARHAP